MHIVYHPGTLGLVYKALSHIGMVFSIPTKVVHKTISHICGDFSIPTKVSSSDNAESLVLVSLATILFYLLFLFWIS